MISVATWNINSVRLRIDQVARFLTEQAPDVLCLQEIKCRAEQFPYEAFAALGYGHSAVHGQKGYHGVATVSRLPLTELAAQSVSHRVVEETRQWEQCSDHVPLITEFAL